MAYGAMAVIFLCAIAAYFGMATFKSARTENVTNNIKYTGLYLDGTYSPQFAGEMMAETRHYLTRNGAKVRLQSHANQSDFTGFVARQNGIGVTSGQKFLLARWRGEPIVAFGASMLDTTTAIFMQQRSGLRYPKDLVGKRLSFQPGSEDAVVFDAMMARQALPRSQIRNFPVEDKFGALSRGGVDAVIASIADQPVPSDDERTRLNVIRPQDYGIHIPGLVYFASANLVRNNPSIIQQTLNAVISGWQDVYAELDKAVPLLVAFDSERLTPEGMRFGLVQQRDLVRPTGMRIGDFEEGRWNMLRDILLFAKMGEQSESLSAGITYDFLREFYRRPLNVESGRSGAFDKTN